MHDATAPKPTTSVQRVMGWRSRPREYARLMRMDRPIGAWLLLWPHVRPWRMRHPEPMLRSLPDAAHVAAILAPALTAANGANAATLPVRQPTQRRKTAATAALTGART